MFMFLHDGQTSFYIQASTDFVVVAQPKYDVHSNSETVILERVLESRASKLARDEHLRQSTGNVHAASVHAVHAVGGGVFAAPDGAPTASNNFDPDEKQEVRFCRTQYGLQVLCHDFPPHPLAGPTRDVDVVERTAPWGIGWVGLPLGYRRQVSFGFPQVHCCRVPQRVTQLDPIAATTEVEENNETSSPKRRNS